ncbi:hypothetical protein [Janthinobacterium sp. RT4P48]|uniref:hypothetical protein n=1 Tax=Janthinobacterium sp. RT4P48 TaxID=3424188 RepID=UPI003F51D270
MTIDFHSLSNEISVSQESINQLSGFLHHIDTTFGDCLHFDSKSLKMLKKYRFTVGSIPAVSTTE